MSVIYLEYVFNCRKIFYVKMEVTYMFNFRPGESRFREKWLKDVIESKVLMMQAVEF